MTEAEWIVNAPDEDRPRRVARAASYVLEAALDLAKKRGAAHAAADIAFELGRRWG